MTRPIGSRFCNPPRPHPCYDDLIGIAAKDFCGNASTLCDETTVVSNACRSATNAVDAFVCDDKNMADASADGNDKS